MAQLSCRKSCSRARLSFWLCRGPYRHTDHLNRLRNVHFSQFRRAMRVCSVMFWRRSVIVSDSLMATRKVKNKLRTIKGTTEKKTFRDSDRNTLSINMALLNS